ncbi:zinc finger protein 26-like [Culicoides brevitarsis]|uniref:zinc finger protein 26-like n=1 Tax=Culicoides brevitarsis TaxID=469753 RepID=UPI00307BE15D
MTENQCRVCLKFIKCPFKLNDTIQEMLIWQALNKIADISVAVGDPLPQSICSSCYSRLDLVVQFRNEVEKNDKILQQEIISCIKTEDEDFEAKELKQEEIFEPPLVQRSRSGRIIKPKITSFDENAEKMTKSEKILKKESLQKPEIEVLSSTKPKNLKTRHQKGTFPCCICRTEVFPLESDLISHISSCHMSKVNENESLEYPKDHRYKCNFCKTKFRLKKSITEHVGDASYLEPKKDRQEEYQKRKSKLTEETLEAKNKEEKVVCVYCGKIFSNRARQIEHELRAHAESYPIVCPHPGCDKRFAGDLILKRHLLCHGEKKFSCEVCGKKFLKRKNLVSHSYLHQDVKRYQCAHCPRTFTYRTVLKQHIESHMQLKVFPCLQCSKQYKWYSDLQKHIKYEHLNDPPYKCIYCSKGYFSSSSRKYHQERCALRNQC